MEFVQAFHFDEKEYLKNLIQNNSDLLLEQDISEILNEHDHYMNINIVFLRENGQITSKIYNCDNNNEIQLNDCPIGFKEYYNNCYNFIMQNEKQGVAV